MFIAVPLILITISIVGVMVVIRRKIPYLKKLDVETLTANGSSLSWKEFFSDMLPELNDGQHKFKEFKELWLSELEKFIRKMRLFSLKVDNLSGVLIKKIRRVNRQQPIVLNGEPKIEDVFTNKISTQDVSKSEEIKPDMADLKQKEQSLIIKIAKDPKNTDLYKELADLYTAMFQWKDAEEALKAAIDLSPEDEDLKKKLSSVLEKINSQN